MAVALGVFDLYDGIATYVEATVVPISVAAISLVSTTIHLIMCFRLNRELKLEVGSRNLRSIGHGLVLTSKKRVALQQEYRHVGVSFGLVISYTIFNYPYMFYSLLELEKRKHCESSGMDLYNVLVMVLALKTVADPIVCIGTIAFIAKYWRQQRQQESESLT